MADYRIEQKTDKATGHKRWYLTPEGEKEPVAFSTSKKTLMDRAIDLTAGRGQIMVRDPKTGRWTGESR